MRPAARRSRRIVIWSRKMLESIIYRRPAVGTQHRTTRHLWSGRANAAVATFVRNGANSRRPEQLAAGEQTRAQLLRKPATDQHLDAHAQLAV